MKKLMFIITVFILSISSIGYSQYVLVDQNVFMYDKENKKIGTEYIIHLDNVIRHIQDYREVIKVLNNAKENDSVIIKFNTPGGSVYASIQIIDSIKKCKAKTIAEIYVAMSMGAVIALCCDEIVINDYSIMMIHNIRNFNGIRGNITDIESETKHMSKLNRCLLNNTFKCFLNLNEINRILHGKELWLLGEDINKRIQECK